MSYETLIASCTPGQRDAIMRTDEPAFIMAGAGTGKTFTLSRKLAFGMCDEENDDPSRFMAITFTEAAAAELMDRARASARMSGSETADEIEAAWISTIHSMCRRMLAENALDAKMDPGLVVMTEVQAAETMSAAIEEAIGEAMAYTRQDQSAPDIIGIGYNALSGMVSRLLTIAACVPGGVESIDFGPYETPNGQAVTSSIATLLTSAAIQYRQVAPSKKADVAEKIIADALWLEELARAFSDNTIKVETIENVSLRSGVKEVSEQKAAVKTALAQALSVLSIETESSLVGAIRDIAISAEHKFAEMIDAQNKLTFDALLSRCHELLSNDVLSRTYSARFDAIMVDEFQDTDSQQASIISRLCRDERGISKLAVVGDRQQSIYGFRGAEVEVSDDMQQLMEAEYQNATIPLDVNFRSNPDILAFVGDVFGSPAFFGSNFLNLVPGPANASFAVAGDSTYPVEVACSLEPSSTSSATSRKAQAAYIARRFQELAAADPDLSYDGMALVLRSLSNVEDYQQAFRELGIPSAITGGRKFYSFAEVHAAVAILEVLESVDDDLGLFQLLTSEVFGCSDKDLTALKRIWKDANPKDADPVHIPELVGTPDIPQDIVCAIEIISQARRALSDTPISQVYWAVCQASGWIESVFLDEMGYAGRIANIVKMKDMLEALEAQYGLDHPSIVAEIVAAAEAAESFRGKDNTTIPGRTIGTDNPGCVSIMTIHASKGLEFDVVAAASLESNKNDSSTILSTAARDKAGNRKMRVSIDMWKASSAMKSAFADMLDEDLDTACSHPLSYAGYIGALSEKTQRAKMAENKRLVYVALTRAKKKLIWCAAPNVTGKGTLGATDKIFQEAAEALGLDLTNTTNGNFVTPSGIPFTFARITVDADDVEPLVQTDVERASMKHFELMEFGRTEEAPDRRRQVSFSSSYAGSSPSSTVLDLMGINRQAPARHGDGHGAAFGSVFHECARRLALMGKVPSPVDVSRICSAFEEEIDKNAIITLVSELASSATWDKITSQDFFMPEAPLRYRIDETVFAGSIDVLCVTDRLAVIYDYKTGMSDATDEQVLSSYAYQALVYAAGVLFDNTVDAVQVCFVMVDDHMRLVEGPIWTSDDQERMFEVLQTDENS